MIPVIPTEIQLADHVVTNFIKKHKYKFVSIDAVSDYLKKKLGDEYTSELSIAVKNALTDDERLDFYKEGDYVHEQKYHYCVGNWLAIKGEYKNPIEAKDKMGWYSWQSTEEINWDED